MRMRKSAIAIVTINHIGTVTTSRQGYAGGGEVAQVAEVVLAELVGEESEYAINGFLLPVGGDRRVAAALELDPDEGVADLAGEGLEPLPHGRVLAVAQAEDLAAGGGPFLHGAQVGRGEVEVA